MQKRTNPFSNPKMNTTKLIEILRWPATKRNGMYPWYVIVWRLCVYPFLVLFGLGFYLSILLLTFSLYEAETFRKEWF